MAKKRYTWIVLCAIIALLLLSFAGIMIYRYTDSRVIKTLDKMVYLDGQELLNQNNAKGKSGYFVLMFDRNSEVVVESEMLEYLTLLIRKSKSDYALPMFGFDTKSYANAKYIYTGLDTNIKDITSISELVINPDELPILVLFTAVGTVDTVYITVSDIIEALSSQRSKINFII